MATNPEFKMEFRKIPSLKFLYEVNCDGTIIRNVKSKRHLKCFIKKRHENDRSDGYWCTQIKIAKKVHKVFLHVVVAECWIGPKPKGLEVDHIDRNSLNNHFTNLRYVTKSEQNRNRDHDKFMDSWWRNLSLKNGGEFNPVKLTRDGETIEFPTAKRASKYLTTIYPDKKEKSFDDKFHLRRRHIFDYDVAYLNEETGHSNHDMGKVQST